MCQLYCDGVKIGDRISLAKIGFADPMDDIWKEEPVIHKAMIRGNINSCARYILPPADDICKEDSITYCLVDMMNGLRRLE